MKHVDYLLTGSVLLIIARILNAINNSTSSETFMLTQIIGSIVIFMGLSWIMGRFSKILIDAWINEKYKN